MNNTGKCSCAEGFVERIESSILTKVFHWIVSYNELIFYLSLKYFSCCGRIAYITREHQSHKVSNIGTMRRRHGGRGQGGSQTGRPLPPQLCFSGPVRQAFCIVSWYYHTFPSHSPHLYFSPSTLPGLDECDEYDDVFLKYFLCDTCCRSYYC